MWSNTWRNIWALTKEVLMIGTLVVVGSIAFVGAGSVAAALSFSYWGGASPQGTAAGPWGFHGVGQDAAGWTDTLQTEVWLLGTPSSHHNCLGESVLDPQLGSCVRNVVPIEMPMVAEAGALLNGAIYCGSPIVFRPYQYKHWSIAPGQQYAALANEIRQAGQAQCPVIATGCEDYENLSEEDQCACDGYEWMPGLEGGEPYCSGPPPSPILLPITDHGLKKEDLYRLTPPTGGVLFDHDGDGIKEATAWTLPNSKVGFLALDRDGNGKIDSGKELYGNYTYPHKPNGFEALQIDAGNNTGYIDEQNPLYARLLIWVDKNKDGESQPAELLKFSDYYTMIGTLAIEYRRIDPHGSEFRWQGWAERRTASGQNKSNTGREHQDRLVNIYDVFFAVVQ